MFADHLIIERLAEAISRLATAMFLGHFANLVPHFIQRGTKLETFMKILILLLFLAGCATAPQIQYP